MKIKGEKMDEKEFLRMRVMEKTEEMLNYGEEVEQKKPFKYMNQTNPIYRNLARFHNISAPKKWSVRDLLR